MAELAAFRRMLVVSRGVFSLSFSVCNNRTLRDELIGRLMAETPGIVRVELPAGTTDVLQTVHLQLSDAPRTAVFVLDLEASIPFEATWQPTLKGLNASRELWPPLACPVVFWLADYAAARVATQAPDFWRYRSHQFEFVAESPSTQLLQTDAFPGFAQIAGLSHDEKRFRRAELEDRLRELGPTPPPELVEHLREWKRELAELYEAFSQFQQAEELMRELVREAEAKFGPDDPRTAIEYNNLAQLLQDTNRLAEAEPLMRRVLAVDEEFYGTEHCNVAIDLSNLAQLLQDTNRLAEAEPLMRRALAIAEQSYGAEHPTVAIRLNNLAMLLRATNRLAEAEPMMRRALAIAEQSYGAEHPTVANRLNNLATLLQATNRLAEAEPLMRRALAIAEQSYGAEHPTVANRLNNLALLLQDTNRLAEAEPLMRRALAIDEQSYGADHPDVAIDLNNLATLLQATNRLTEAEPLMRRHVEILVHFTRVIGHEHPHLKNAFANYAKLLKVMGRSQTEIDAGVQTLSDETVRDDAK